MSDATNQTKAWYERNGREKYLDGRDPHYLDLHLKNLADHFLAEFPVDGSVLDIGSAGAFRYESLRKFLPECQYESCDIAQSFVDLARQKYPQFEHFECNIADSDTLPRHTYASIICLAVLQHVGEDEIQAAVCNVYQLLQPGGFSLISLPDAHIGGYEGDTRHFTILTHEQQLNLLHRAGFKIRTEDTTKGFKSADGWRIYLAQKT